MQHRKGNAKPIGELNPAISAEVASLVEDMMEVEPAQRVQTMADVRDRIREMLG